MEGNAPISARIASDGTLRVLGLLALRAAKEPSALIGFEEPEHDIHPGRLDLIALLLKNLASDDTQVIVTTHSPILPDFIPHESLYVCRKRKGRTIIEPFSVWEYPDVHKILDDEEDIPERTVSERILRGDFDA